MFIFDSSQKKKVLFEPISEKNVYMYVCGPTVYDEAHLGHARSAIVFDLLRRVLEQKYSVTFARNYTDIDDKILNKMQETNMSLEEITSKYIKSYEKQMDELLIKKPNITPKATQSLEPMMECIEKLLENKHAYILEDGVYFDTSSDKDYLKLSNQHQDEVATQARIETVDGKKSLKDFALWKKTKENESVSYSSPFGRGRPGWHLECSAMIAKHLAQKGEFQIDIHGGGADLLFPHHENEAAQTRCAYNQNLAKYWVHNGFVTINGEKMSKSLGNSFYLHEALNAYHGEIIRFYLLSTHYRANFNFSESDLLQSKKRLDKYYRLKKRIFNKIGNASVNEEFKQNFMDALNDDLNISKALAVLDEMVTLSNEKLDLEKNNKTLQSEIYANLDFASEVLGILTLDSFEYFKLGVSKEKEDMILKIIEERNIAKQNKNYIEADKLRNELLKENIHLMDSADGTQWEYIAE